MLNTYLQLTRLLLADIDFARVNDFDLTAYVNQARAQVAARGRCIRVYATLPLAAGEREYPFSSVAGLPAGTSGIYHIRQAWLRLPGTPGQIRIVSRPFEWFGLFALNNAVPPQGQTRYWSQFGQGEAGTIFVDPVPDGSYTLRLDVLGTPEPLVSDSDPEAIPDIWTLAVPFYAAWLGFQSAQRQDEADKMEQRFQSQMALARAAATPDLTMESWSQSPDPEEANRLGSRGAAA